MELDAVINVAEDRTDAVLILHVELEVADHAEVLNKAGHGTVQPAEAGTLHDGIPILRVGHGIVIGAAALGLAPGHLGGVVVQEEGIGSDEALQVLFAHLVLHEVHLGEDVDVRDLEHDHGRHGAQRAREELCAVDDKGRLEQVGGAEADVEVARLGEEARQGGQDRHVRVQLNLARHVKDDKVLLRQRVEALGQEVEILHQELEAVDESTVGPQAHFFHDILERDEIFNVQVGLVLKGFGGRVEIDVEA